MFRRFLPFFLILMLCSCNLDKKPARIITHSGLGILAASISNDSHQALVSTVDLGVQFWDLSQNKVQFTLKHPGKDQDIIAMDLARENPIAVSLSADSLVVWNTDSGQAYRFLALKSQPTSVALSNTGKYALVGFINYRAQLIDLSQGLVLREFEHADIVNTVALSNNNQYAIIGSDDTAVRVWDLNSGEMLYQWFHPAKVNHLEIAPNNRYVLSTSSQHKAWVHDLQNGKQVAELKLTPKFNIFRVLPPSVTASIFSKDSKTLITAHPPKAIKIWDVKTGKLKQEFTIPARSFWRPSASVVIALGLNEQENQLTAEASNGRAYIFNLKQRL